MWKLMCVCACVCANCSDGPGPNASATAGKWGAYTCDTPDALLENLLAHLQKLQSSPDTAVDFVRRVLQNQAWMCLALLTRCGVSLFV